MDEVDPPKPNEENDSIRKPDDPAADAESKLRSNYTKLIRLKGITSSQTEINARKLGIDVDALVAEREREINAWKIIEVRLDLATLTLGRGGAPLEIHFTQWQSRSILLTTTAPILDLPGLSIYGAIKLGAVPEITVADLLRAGVHLILKKLRDHPDEFRHSLPWGIKDIELDRLVFDDSRKTWILFGARKSAALERTSRSLHPSRSIDLARRAVREGTRFKAKPWPEVEEVRLRVERWPTGALRVTDAFESVEESGPDRVPTYSDLSHTFTLKYPCPGKFQWHDLGATKPATHFLKSHLFRQAGNLAQDAGSLGVESIICDYSSPMPVTDYRGSIRSGTDGPAPLPTGQAWPNCRNCGKIPSFWESIDFRDVSFFHLLLGTTLSIFVCDRCLEAGEWQACTTLIWLVGERFVDLVSRGDSMPPLEARQWIDRDCSNDDVPAVLAARVESECPADLPCGLASIAEGTKAGGWPYYLGAAPVLFDADGCLMDYIGQFTPPESSWFGGYGYIFHSATTGETVAELQST